MDLGFLLQSISQVSYVLMTHGPLYFLEWLLLINDILDRTIRYK